MRTAGKVAKILLSYKSRLPCAFPGFLQTSNTNSTDCTFICFIIKNTTLEFKLNSFFSPWLKQRCRNGQVLVIVGNPYIFWRHNTKLRLYTTVGASVKTILSAPCAWRALHGEKVSRFDATCSTVLRLMSSTRRRVAKPDDNLALGSAAFRTHVSTVRGISSLPRSPQQRFSAYYNTVFEIRG